MDWLTELFGEPATAEETAAAAVRMQEARDAERARCEKVLADMSAPDVAPNRCPRCMGSGKLPQFTYRSGGVCFRCGGAGTI